MLSFSEQVIVHKYMLEFFKINLNFKNHFNKSFFFDKKRSLKMLVNGFFVSPMYLNIYLFLSIVKTGKTLSAHSQKKLEDYISLTRANFSPLIKSWCDWCSIVNGYCTFAIATINEHDEDYNEKYLDIKTLRKLKFLFACTSHIKIMLERDNYFADKKPSSSRALFPEIYDKASPPIKSFLDSITKKYNQFQIVEQQWCPFQHMKRIALLTYGDRERYESYLNCKDYKDVVKAGELIFNFKHLKCNQCVNVINTFLESEAGYLDNKLHLRTEDFLDLICKLSR
ncbi:Uncharacterised protein [Legionella beliardensis]|uniref:Uncharacterized protein n=1 Tax=Legionella beliardensis TaxID=91822 RepID=A0A378I3F9_9GAMM|nr:hypothetical protein [Legionella beliardensis]STX29698.1 Uncharacterised protein [Legionella beliardensis]